MKDFSTKAIQAINHNFKPEKDKYSDSTFHINTIFGRLSITLRPDQKADFYLIFMRFTEPLKFDLDKFIKVMPSYFVPLNRYSLKWNLMNSSPDFVLGAFTERLETLRQLETND